MPKSSRILACVGIFSLFASIGFVYLLMTPYKHTWPAVVCTICIYAGFAVGYALFSIARKFWMLPIWGILQGLAFGIAANVFRPTAIHDLKELHAQLLRLGGCAIGSTICGYVVFIVFTRREGNRFFRIQTEIELAREIHRSLVPAFDRKIPGYEVFGASIASGEVGGDLVDVAEYPAGWISYIADISGHGVSSGVLMAMFKTSIRSRLANGGSPGELLDEVHRALYPLKMQNMFVTAGVLQLSAGNQLTYALAGHPPLMHYKRAQRTIIEYGAHNMPLGILPEQHFSVDALQCDPGDVLLLLTDGFSEVFKQDGTELGLEPLKREFQNAAERPLQEIFDRLHKLSLSFGKQDDDQTMLLVRCF